MSSGDKTEKEKETETQIEDMIKFKKYNESYECIINNNFFSNINNNAIYIEIGNYKFDNDEYEEALIMYENIENIENDILLVNIAYCYQQLTKPKEALKYYYKYLNLSENNKSDIYCIHNIAVLEYYNKNYNSALKMYNKMSHEYINRNLLYFNIGICYMNINENINDDNNYEMALKYFYKNLQITNKNRDNCLISIGWIYSKKFKNYNKALQIYNKISENTIFSHNLEFDIAWTYQQLNKYLKALKYYKLYLKKYSNNINTLHNIAWIYINEPSLNKYINKAKPLLVKILKIHKNHFYANYTYGIYLRDIEKNYLLSIKCLIIAHNIQPNNIQIIIDIAKIYKLTNNISKAKIYYLKAINIDKNDSYSNIEYAHFLAIIGNYKLSDYYYKIAFNNLGIMNSDLINNINIVENYTNYGHVLHKLNKNKQAIQLLETALKINANDENTLNNLGYYNYIIGNFIKSEKYLKLCLKINPNHEFTNSTCANLLYHSKKYSHAEIYFKSAIKLKSDVNNIDIGPEILYNYSMLLYNHKKDYHKSIKYCKQFIQLFNNLNTKYNDKIYYLIANNYINIKQNNYAKIYINKALKINPQNNKYKILYNKLNK
eukprot:453853_1